MSRDEFKLLNTLLKKFNSVVITNNYPSIDDVIRITDGIIGNE